MLDTFVGLAPQAAGGWVNKSPADDYWYEPRGVETVSGQSIDEDAALAITTVFAIVAKVCKTVATLPLTVVEKTAPNTRHPVDHWLGELLDDAANEAATGLTAREAAQGNLELWGKHAYRIDWDSRMREPRRLTLLESRHMQMHRDEDGRLFAVYRPPSSGEEIIPPDQLWYTPGFSLNGMTGLSVIAYNRAALGLMAAATEFGEAFFGNGMWAGGFFQRPEGAPALSPEAGEKWLRSMNEKFRGTRKAFGFGLLREGMDFKQINMPFEDAMFLATKKFQRVELCGLFDVPLIMIQDDEHSTYRNSEQADIAFAKHSILPRCLRLEKSARWRFLLGTKLYLKHNLAGLVRGDFKTMMEGFAIGRQWGIFSINDCLALLDRNPIEAGDTHLEPLNMVPVGAPRPLPSPPSEQRQLTAEPLPAAALRPAVQHAAELIVNRQCKAAGEAWRKHASGGRLDTFRAWGAKFFKGHAKVARGEIEPILRGFEEVSGTRLDATAQDVADGLCAECHDALMAAAERPEGVPALVEDWKENLAALIVERLEQITTTEPKGD